MSDMARVLAAIERNRRRIWALCYRMTGSCADADDLSQEALARAIERADQATSEDSTGWLLSIATRLCIDHCRRADVRRRATELADPLGGSEWQLREANPENELILRDDVRFAVVVALQRLSPKQRAVLILKDVCDRSLEEVAEMLDSNPNAVKALLHRARVALAEARYHPHVDVPVDPEVVEDMARAIEEGSIDRITALFAEDVWGIVDRGPAEAEGKPTFGRRAVSRQWANAKKQLDLPMRAEIRSLNGEPAIVVRVAEAPETVVAVVHLETRANRVVSLRVLRDPERSGEVAARLTMVR